MRKIYFFTVVLMMMFSVFFCFTSCKDTEIIPDGYVDMNNPTDLVKDGLFGRVKSKTLYNYNVVWDSVEQVPKVIDENPRSREIFEYNESGFLVGVKNESYIPTYTVTSDKIIENGKNCIQDILGTITHDNNNRILTFEVLEYNEELYIIVEGYRNSPEKDTIKNLNGYCIYNASEKSYSFSPYIYEYYPNIKFVSYGYLAGNFSYFNEFYFYDDVAKTGKKISTNKKNGITRDSIVFTCSKLLPNGKIDLDNGFSSKYRQVSTMALELVSDHMKKITERDEKGNPVLEYQIYYSLRSDSSINHSWVDISNYTVTSYSYY